MASSQASASRERVSAAFACSCAWRTAAAAFSTRSLSAGSPGESSTEIAMATPLYRPQGSEASVCPDRDRLQSPECDFDRVENAYAVMRRAAFEAGLTPLGRVESCLVSRAGR